eukprot:CAMPEP_0185750372 /NCGR_PEP_ID=MMETSP1174-20130828/9143_1 /TAXON_ID=35687 /ORGANISM="Dictyocha speculum, Strain CCMP1381" /LENGTH=47 /DNA_ID= /DNA_START= /DNA_END= /DNA_ORIENTATION=
MKDAQHGPVLMAGAHAHAELVLARLHAAAHHEPVPGLEDVERTADPR